ncbi:MAG: hypothetical protein QXS42_06255 [Zestosphaera sp.]
MFKEALEVVESALKTYEEMKSREGSAFKGGASTTLALTSELLAKFREVVSAAASVEEVVTSPSLKTGKVCEGLTYVNDEHAVALIHRSPLAAVSYRKRSRKVVLSSKYTSLSLGVDELEVRYRDRVTVLRLAVKDDIIGSSSMLRALASEELNLVRYTSALVESCRRKLGLR